MRPCESLGAFALENGNPVVQDVENGLLGFANPTYQLDDAVNCNTAPDDSIYDELYQELDSVCNFRRGPSIKNRRSYASLDLGSMGIDLTAGPATTTTTATTTITTLDNPINNEDNNRNTDLERTTTSSTSTEDCVPDNEKVANLGLTNNGLLDYYLNLDQVTGNQRTRPDLLETADQRHTPTTNTDSDVRGMDINSPDSNDSGIQETIPHISGQLTNELYAVPVKRKVASSPTNEPPSDDKVSPTIEEPKEEILPPGWERHEDNDGPYYWHIKSGTIQREPPPPPPPNYKEPKRSISKESETNSTVSSTSVNSSTTTTTASITAVENDNNTQKTENAYKRRSYPRAEFEKEKHPIRFAVRSLGWVEIAEEDLTPERSSKAVNKCIVDLSLGRNDILDVVGRWGDGKDLYMDLDDHSLKLVDPENLTVLNTQPIHTIRVWGVGRDNGSNQQTDESTSNHRDFAYVARDRASRKHMCHVFRCDTPARTIANTLRDICKRIMLERSLSQNLARQVETGSNGSSLGRSGLVRPTNLPTEHRRFHHRLPHVSYSAQSFPTPMEEPKKVLKVRYVGVMQVPKASGMEVLNQAIEHLASSVPSDQWQYVNVAVAPSTITITEQGDEGKQIAECRVRFLSFLGIGRNVKHCAFIMRTAQDQFMAHVFHCEPSSGALCKTIEAACKLRYQKCLDAHPPGMDRNHIDSQHSRGIGAALKSMLGSLTGRKARSAES